MAWKISFPCGALYLCTNKYTYLMLLFFRWPEYIRLYQSYDMTDQFPVWCTLFVLYSLLLLVICSESGWLCQWYGMKDQFSLWCTFLYLFILYLMLLLFRCIESGWLYQFYNMTYQFSLWCTLFGLHFICSARSTTKLTGRNRTYPHYLPICQGNCILFHILQR